MAEERYNEPRTLAEKFVAEELVYQDYPTTPTQHIVGGTIRFDDGSYVVIVEDEGVVLIGPDSGWNGP